MRSAGWSLFGLGGFRRRVAPSVLSCGIENRREPRGKSLPQNKKPGVERRVQPPTLRWLHAMLDFVLACARKEPHYRIYFLAFAWYYVGKTLLRPDCDAPAGSATPEPFVSIPIFLYPSSP